MPATPCGVPPRSTGALSPTPSGWCCCVALKPAPLTDDERAAVDDGQVALDKLLAQLADAPTPAGPTPRQLGHHAAGPQLLQILPGRPVT
jgi:hypothetical protein